MDCRARIRAGLKTDKRFLTTPLRLNGCARGVAFDGSAHNDSKRYDAGRDRWLLDRHGVRPLRLTNQEILGNLQVAIKEATELMSEQL